MNAKKSIFWIFTMLALICVFAGTMAVEAAEFTLLGEQCKDVVNDGLPFTTPVSVSGSTVENWRDRIQVQVEDPNGNLYGIPYGTGDIVKEVVLYAASDNTAYQCQQLTTDGSENSFSCNSFPAGGTIARVNIRFIPNFTGSVLELNVYEGNYTITVVDLNTTTNILLNGTAEVDAYSSACAWNQLSKAFTPATGTNFVYENCGADLQAFNFVENTASPFTIVSFPLGETIDPSRFKVIASPKTSQINYTVDFTFDDNDDDSDPDSDLTIRYDYDAATGNETLAPLYPDAWSDPGTGGIRSRMPIKLTGGKLYMNNEVNKNLLPSQVDYQFILYYQNIDPTLGVENSIFRFDRSMSFQISAYCSTSAKTKLAPTTYDPCTASKQVFSISFIDPAGLGYDIEGDSTYRVTAPGTYDIVENTYDETPSRTMYFDTKKCTNTDCTTVSGTDAYVYRVYVDDGEMDNRYWHYDSLSGSTVSRIPSMKIFDGPGRRFRVNTILMTASSAGTYRVRAFIPDNLDDIYLNRAWMEFYVTISQKDGMTTCRSSGQDGVYNADWDGCGENYDTQSIEFIADDEQYGFVSNYSNQTLTYDFSATRSDLPSALSITELYCEGQILADGYSLDGSVCSPQKLVLPPYTRIIIKGGKFNLTQKPTFNSNDDPEFILAYNRALTDSNMNLFIDIDLEECPLEAIPDTGYSLRSPQPMSVNAQEYIFTGNSLQIPAIGLGMEYPIPIVHLGYVDDKFENGWDLSLLGSYIGELEGGSYIPYGGNSVLTGHFYSQGVFVNLVNLHLEDEIIVYATDGMKYTYSVNNSYWTEPTDVYQMFQPNGEKSLTLVTCDDYNFINDEYQKRYIVQATLISTEPYQ